MTSERFVPTNHDVLEAHYGPGVSGVLRAEGFPSEPQSWFVQRQDVTSGGLSRWFTEAVYESQEAAEEAAKRWGNEAGERFQINQEQGETTAVEQPVSVYRVVSLTDLFAEGDEILAATLFDLCTSDHEWHVSTELGSEGKVALNKAALEH